VAAVSLEPADLEPFADIPEVKAQAMIEDALALAARVAPCILDAEFEHDTAARAILRGAVLRWHEAGSGALQSEGIGPYNYTTDNRQTRKGMFWPSEIEQLQELCRTSGPAGAFTLDTIGTAIEQHADICALRFGADYCSCGAVLTMNLPLYENYW
jgi:hypothetical protein